MSANQDFFLWNGGLKGVANFMAGNIYGDEDLEVKMTHDTYDVFLNGRYVGTRVSTEGDRGWRAVPEMLRRRGYDPDVEVDGDRIVLSTDDENARMIHDELSIWLQIK